MIHGKIYLIKIDIFRYFFLYYIHLYKDFNPPPNFFPLIILQLSLEKRVGIWYSFFVKKLYGR